LGWLGLSVAEFETITFFQFNCKLKGWQEQRDARSREQYETARLLIDGIWRTVAWKNRQVPDVREMYPMPWDPKPEQPQGESEWEMVSRKYKFLKIRPEMKFNRDIMALIEKHRPALEKEFGPIKKA